LYKAHIAVEKNIIKLGKTENLKGYVVGEGEGTKHCEINEFMVIEYISDDCGCIS